MAHAGDKMADKAPPNREVYSSKGFDDVPEYGASIPGGIRPYDIVNKDGKRTVTILAKDCLQFFNSTQGVRKAGKFKLGKVVKVNCQCVGAGLMFYITFTAGISYLGSYTFHGKIWKTLKGFDHVKFCEMVTEQVSTTS